MMLHIILVKQEWIGSQKTSESLSISLLFFESALYSVKQGPNV
jgi:hypothetical protein